MRSPYGSTHTPLLHSVRGELVPVGFHGSQRSARPAGRWEPGCASPFQYSRWTRCTLCLCVPSWSVRVVLRTSPAGQPSLILHVCHRRQMFRSVCHSLGHTASASSIWIVNGAGVGLVAVAAMPTCLLKAAYFLSLYGVHAVGVNEPARESWGHRICCTLSKTSAIVYSHP